ncbi:MAG: beta-L-arabinofuranosidase domain-containing protein [Acidobacteriota bacterium]
MRIARLLVVTLLLGSGAAAQTPRPDYPTTPVPFTDVTFADTFWAPRLETVRTVTLRATFKQSEETGRIRNFEIAGGTAEGAFCTRYSFDDSDVFKIIEGAGYALATKKDPDLEQYVDGLVAKIARAQETDGYLFTARTISPANPIAMAGKERWVNLQHSHELYNLGHLYEAAVAYYQGTGKRTLLDVALKSADLIVREFGPSKRRAVPGHQEIEIGLVKLFRVTGGRKYLDQAFFFLDQRGRADRGALYGEYAQDHKPVAEQTEAVGHSVRAAYMYSAMADVGVLTGNQAYLSALDRLWDNVVSRKLYLTGGIGATGAWEGFGPDYDLPNSAYAETCASIANALWNHRMFLLEQDARYMDVYERAVYNAMLSGLSLSGDRFFYPNPLLSVGQHQRSPWFPCACCPSNLPRFLLSMPGHAYAVAGDRIFVNLFVAGRARANVAGREITIEQQTRYPWDGDIRLRMASAGPGTFALLIRIPGWARHQPVPGDLYRELVPAGNVPVIRVNGVVAEWTSERGYAVLRREWSQGDEVQLSLPMPVRRVVSHPAVKANAGRVAIERGPLVYAAEWPDNGGHVLNLVLDDKAPLITRDRPDLFDGVVVVTGPATAYRTGDGKATPAPSLLTLIPYYAWAHRGPGEMQVWMARDFSAGIQEWKVR